MDGCDRNLAPRGAPIPGSRLVRDYCFFCGEAIRVIPAMAGKPNACLECSGRKTPRPRDPSYRHDPSPSQENAVRALEDQ